MAIFALIGLLSCNGAGGEQASCDPKTCTIGTHCVEQSTTCVRWDVRVDADDLQITDFVIADGPPTKASAEVVTTSESEPQFYITAYRKVTGDLLLGIYDRVDERFYFQNVDQRGNAGRTAKLALDSKASPMIAYSNDTGSSLHFAHFSDGWQLSTIDATADVSHDISLTVDSKDYAHVAYRDATHGMLRYARQQANSYWQNAVVDNANDASPPMPASEQCDEQRRLETRRGVGYGTSIDIYGGIPIISYHDADCATLRMATLGAEESWEISTIGQYPPSADRYGHIIYRPVGRFSRIFDYQTPQNAGGIVVIFNDAWRGNLDVMTQMGEIRTRYIVDDGVIPREPWGASKSVVAQDIVVAVGQRNIWILHSNLDENLRLTRLWQGEDLTLDAKTHTLNRPTARSAVIATHADNVYLIVQDKKDGRIQFSQLDLSAWLDES